MSQCHANTKKGAFCKAPAMAGGLCFFHANPKLARELGRVGGRRNRQQTQDTPTTKTMTIIQVNEALVNSILDVRSKKISARTGSTLAQLYSVLLRATPVADHEARITRLEELKEEGTADALDAEPGVKPPDGGPTLAGTEVPGPTGRSPLIMVKEQMLDRPAAAASDGEPASSPTKGSEAQDGAEPGKPHVSIPHEVAERPPATSDVRLEGSQRKECASVHKEVEAEASGKPQWLSIVKKAD